MSSDADNSARTFPGPVVHLRQPGDAVTIVLEPAPDPAQYPAELVLPCRVRVTAQLDVYDRPDGTVIRQAAIGGQVDVYERRGAWWRVTQPPQREMWVRAGRLVL